MDEIEIREAGLLLRPLRAGDADAVYRACQDPEISRWTRVASPYTRELAEAFVTGFSRQHWVDGTKAPFGVFDATTHELLASNGLISLDLELHTAEVGYWVAPWARGRGVATDSTRAVARWALDTLGVTHLAWRAKLGNHASRLVAERVGFQIEGVLREPPGSPEAPGKWVGSLLPGELREADAPVDPVRRTQARTFQQPQPVLDAGPVRLRPVRPSDAEAVLAACRDPESLRWTTVPDPYQAEDALTWVATRCPEKWLRGDGAVFAIAGPDDTFLGSMDLDLLSTTVGDVGYLVAPEARGKGYGSAALRAVCDWGFAALGLHRIEWRAFVGNEASRRTAVRAGFTVEGLARALCTQRGELRDAWVGARLRTDEARS